MAKWSKAAARRESNNRALVCQRLASYSQHMKTYGQVVDSIEALPDEQQESLMELLQRRLVERRREILFKSVQEARKEFKTGKCRPATPAEIMRKVLA